MSVNRRDGVSWELESDLYDRMTYDPESTSSWAEGYIEGALAAFAVMGMAEAIRKRKTIMCLHHGAGVESSEGDPEVNG